MKRKNKTSIIQIQEQKQSHHQLKTTQQKRKMKPNSSRVGPRKISKREQKKKKRENEKNLERVKEKFTYILPDDEHELQLGI